MNNEEVCPILVPNCATGWGFDFLRFHRPLLAKSHPSMRLPLRRSVSDKLIRPLDEVLHIRQIGVSTIVLTPSKLAIQ